MYDPQSTHKDKDNEKRPKTQERLRWDEGENKSMSDDESCATPEFSKLPHPSVRPSAPYHVPLPVTVTPKRTCSLASGPLMRYTPEYCTRSHHQVPNRIPASIWAHAILHLGAPAAVQASSSLNTSCIQKNTSTRSSSRKLIFSFQQSLVLFKRCRIPPLVDSTAEKFSEFWRFVPT